MKKIISLFMFSFLFSQNGYIEGIVLSENADTLAGANVYVEGTNIGAACNMYGEFVLENLIPGKYTLKVNYIGHKEGIKTLYI